MGNRRRMTRRILLRGAASSAGMVALAACGTATATPESGEAPQEETKTEESPKTMAQTTVSALMVLRGQNETWIKSWLTIFADFEAKHPEHKLEIIDSAFDQVSSKGGHYHGCRFHV